MSEFDFSKYSVLMADPSPQSIERAQAVYDLKGLSRFKGVTTTSKALAELKTFRPHIAFIDMDPGSGGLETIQMIRDHPDGRVSEVPIIILITKVDTNTLKKVCKVGIEGALRKPFDPVRLLRITRLTIIRPQRFISIRSYFGPNRRNKDIGAFDGYDRRKKHPQAEGFTPKGKEDPRLVPLENSGGSGKLTSYKDLRSDGGKGAQSSYVPVRDRPSAERGLKSKSDDSPSWEAIQAGKGKSELSYKPIEGFGTQGKGKDPSWEAMKKEGRDGEISYKAIEGFGTDGKDGDQSWEAIKKEGRDGEISYKAIEGFGTDGKDGGPSWEAMQRDGKEGGASWEEMKKEGREGELSYKAIEGFGKDDPDYNFEEKAAQANEDLKYTPVGTLSEKGDISNADIRAFEEKGEMTFDQMSDDALLAEYGDAFDAEMKAALEGEDAGFINVADLIGKSGGNTMDVMNADELLSGAKSEKAEPEAKRKRPQAKPPRIEFEPEEPKKGIADIPTPEPKKKGMSIAAALEAAEKAKADLTVSQKKKAEERRIEAAKKAAEAKKEIKPVKARPKKAPKAEPVKEAPKAAKAEKAKPEKAPKAKPAPKAAKPVVAEKPKKQKKTKEEASTREKVVVKEETSRVKKPIPTPSEVDNAIGNHKLWLDSGGKEGFQCSLPKADFRGFNMEGRDFTLARMPGAVFTGKDCTDSVFRKAFLSRCDFSGAKLHKCDLAVSRLKAANMSNVKLNLANLRGADLTRANLSGAKLMRCDLSAANLAGTDLTGANLTSARGLMVEQLARAKIDDKTKLPFHLRSEYRELQEAKKAKPKSRRKTVQAAQ